MNIWTVISWVESSVAVKPIHLLCPFWFSVCLINYWERVMLKYLTIDSPWPHLSVMSVCFMCFKVHLVWDIHRIFTLSSESTPLTYELSLWWSFFWYYKHSSFFMINFVCCYLCPLSCNLCFYVKNVFLLENMLPLLFCAYQQSLLFHWSGYYSYLMQLSVWLFKNLLGCLGG